jgi:7,8-dihydroneopterin aldolase/epimerase/oxygenase
MNSTIPVQPARHHIVLEEFAVDVDIGFHDFEIGSPQRLLICVEIGLAPAHFPSEDSRAQAWDYDFIRTGIFDLVRGRRFNLQETLAHEIYAMIAARPGVTFLKIATRKTDVYPDARAVGVILSSE